MRTHWKKKNNKIKTARNKHSDFIESRGAFCYGQIMKNELIISAIKRLVACGMSPCEAFLICDDFIKRYGFDDLEACVRSVEVQYVA